MAFNASEEAGVVFHALWLLQAIAHGDKNFGQKSAKCFAVVGGQIVSVICSRSFLPTADRDPLSSPLRRLTWDDNPSATTNPSMEKKKKKKKCDALEWSKEVKNDTEVLSGHMTLCAEWMYIGCRIVVVPTKCAVNIMNTIRIYMSTIIPI